MSCEPTNETMEFLVRIADSWGTEWARKLAREIAAGTFVELDGKPCTRERPVVVVPSRQMRLGETE